MMHYLVLPSVQAYRIFPASVTISERVGGTGYSSPLPRGSTLSRQLPYQ